MKKRSTLNRRNETFEALQKDVVLAIVKGGGVDGD